MLSAVQRPPEHVSAQPATARQGGGDKKKVVSLKQGHPSKGRAGGCWLPKTGLLSQPQSNICHYAALCAGATIGWHEGKLCLNQHKVKIQTRRVPKPSAVERGLPSQALPKETGWASWSPRPRHSAEKRKIKQRLGYSSWDAALVTSNFCTSAFPWRFFSLRYGLDIFQVCRLSFLRFAGEEFSLCLYLKTPLLQLIKYVWPSPLIKVLIL